MKAEQNQVLPQKGTGPAGESLAVARPPNNGGRATGCPPYSGEGNVTLCASHTQRPLANQLTTTDERQIDTQTATDKLTKTTASSSVSTSLAEAPPPSPTIQSAWTRVEPKHRRKKPKRKKKKTHGQTDTPTGESEGQPTQEPGRIVTNTIQTLARGSHGQSGGPRPPAETVVSGQCKEMVDASRPGTSRGSSADTRYKHTQKGNTSAQRQPHPAAHRSNPHWKERTSGKAGVGLRDPGQSTSQSSQKRDRLDDTISPRGEHKRRKTDRQTGSYARMSQPHLNVAVALTPRTNMTEQEAGNIQGQIEKEIFDTCLKPKTPGAISYAPAFEGRAYLSEGVLKLWCHNEQSLSWLQKALPQLKSPRVGTGLTLIKQTDIPIKVRSALFVPNYEGEVGKLHLVLTLQNPWYEVSTWTLFTHKKIQGRTPGLFLVLGIPKEQIPNILARGRKVAYSTGSIYIRFFTKEGVSDVPPKETPKPEETTKMDTTTKSTDSLTDKHPVSSPEPSVSTILEDIETVLTEETPTRSSPPPNKTRWEETTEDNKTSTTALTLQELLETWAPMAKD